jgi:hypothetical protein
MGDMKSPVLAVVVVALSGSAFAQSAGETQKILEREAQTIRAWGSDATVVTAVKAQNAKRATAAQVKALDEEWAAGKATALVKQVTTGPCAERLRQLIAGNPAYGESLVMDDQGAIVCATAKTTDYWQGDEAKWQRAFNERKGAIFIDRPKLDESAAQRLAQISVPVVEGGQVIGTMTIGITIGK